MALINEYGTVQSHMTIFQNTDVDFIEIVEGVDTTQEKMYASKDTMKIGTVLLTGFKNQTIDASYFDTDETAKSIFTIYKKTPYQKYYQYVCTLSTEYEITDYNVVSNEFYHYLVSIETPNSTGGNEYIIYENTDAEENANYYYVKFDGWTICDVYESEEDENIYIKTGRTWNLGLNLQGEDITYNQSITAWDTLGKYPKVSIGQRKYQSMSFSSLLGQMQEYDSYTFTTEEGVSTGTASNVYEYTEKIDTYNPYRVDSSSTLKDEKWGVWRKYARENDKLLAWNEFITNGNLKLLRDIKGNAWVIQIADSTSYNINTISTKQQTMVNFSWKEAIDISDKSIVKFGDNTEECRETTEE